MGEGESIFDCASVGIGEMTMSTSILVIEDDLTNLELIAYLLNQFGYNVLTAENGERGLEICEEKKPDLIICDIRLPRMDGYEVVRQLKEDTHLNKIPVIAITAYAMAGDKDKILSKGFDGYIPKPISPELFIDQIEAFLKPEQRMTISVRKVEETGTEKKPIPAQTISTSGTILVIDDSAANRELSSTLLKTAGFSVSSVNGFSEALDILKKQTFDLILSDMHLPDTTALELLKILQKDQKLKSIPCIIVSSTSPTQQEQKESFDLGAKAFILRPIDPEAFLKIIEDVWLSIKKPFHQSGSHKALILIVDDNSVNREFLVTLLGYAHYQLLEANDGIEGLKMAQENHPDLIITDILMPQMDGFEFVCQLRKDPELAKTKAIFYTAKYMETEAIDLAKASGVTHFIIKPSEPEEIIQVVEAVLKLPAESVISQPVETLIEKHRQLLTNKLYQASNELDLLNIKLQQRNSERTKELDFNRALADKSVRDPLTGLFNRLYLEEALAREIDCATQNHQQFAVLLFDIDHFKNFNDQFGHDAGDYVLQKISECLKKQIRSGDIACRYGGEEFIVVFLDTTSEYALQRGEQLRKIIEDLEICYETQLLGKITVSVGIAIFPLHGKNEKTLIKAADEALYFAKQSGRNRVIIQDGIEKGK